MQEIEHRSVAMFKPVSSKVDFPAMERDILDWWRESGVMQKYLTRNDGAAERFSFIDGPITANNRMAVHHAWGRTYKDLFQRYKTMKGFEQRYQNGFDCQGLWVEVEVEKELGLNSKREIERFGIEKFVELCKARVRKFADIQTEQSIRLGYWMDWDNSYYTMSDENNYTIWHFLKVCYERGWIYEGTDVMPWCPRCGTGLSQQEVVTEGYREIVHPGLYIRFPLLDREGESLLVWTTTPWTLTSNTGVYVHPELTYAKVRTADGEVLYLLKSRLAEVKAEHEVLEEMPGRDLDGLKYAGPFDELPAQEGVEHRVVLWEEVNESEGTGIVHTAPGAGAEDFKISKERGLSVIAPLDEFGKFVDGFDNLTGKSVFEVNKPIYDSLRGKGVFYRLEQYSHRYPVCWRCDTEVVFRLVDEWFISMDELRGMVAAVTRKIRWIPEFGMQRELDWLKNMNDWMISKKRYWGLALPIYKCTCGHFEIIGSETELEERAVEGWDKFAGHSPHRPWIDAVKIACPECGATVERVRDVGNVWLDAGVVPFSTIGYRSDHDHWKEWFPAELVTESFPGQFRGWFYSMLVMSTALENTEPFLNLHSYATMRDEHGEEMHKSKGNAIWFEDGAEKMGVDAMRWLYARQNPAANLNFGFGVADEVRRRFIIPLWNVYSFFVTYANIDGYDPRTPPPPVSSRPELDRWVVSELNGLVGDVSHALDNYETETAARRIESFVEYLSNWYVRRSRRRFWKSDTDQDKLSAYATLHECLVTLVKLIAPFVPFMSESMYQNLVRSFRPPEGYESVHLDDFPEADASLIDERLSEATRLAMRLSSLGRAARSRAGIKVRQPIEEALVGLRSADEKGLLDDVASQVREELNVRKLSVLDDERQVSRFEVRAEMSLIGPKYGRQTRQVLSALSKADPAEVRAQVASGGKVEIDGFSLEPEEVVVTSAAMDGYAAVSEGGYTVAVTTEITPELELEGRAREMVHLLQNMRRTAGFDIADHIVTSYQGDAELDAVVAAHGEYIRQETLSRELVNRAPPKSAHTESHDVNGLDAVLGVERE
jgi:isoleucyl-tRNA synthetase